LTEHSQQKLAPWVATLALVIAWWLVIRLFDIKSFILPTPWETLQAIYQFR
jgi:NitT/TauT family transport system permease protein